MRRGFQLHKYLGMLGKIGKAKQGFVDTSKLEAEFLTFSSYVQNKELVVRAPKLYAVKGDEVEHMKEYLATTGATENPPGIDISGSFDYGNLDKICLLSPQQLNAGHFSRTRSYLNPLIERIYIDGKNLIRDFAIHEALYGDVRCKRGNLDLREVHMFPKRFTPGPYTLSVNLDTTNQSVRKFHELTQTLEDFARNPKASMLDKKKFDKTVTKAVELRTILGALSRYHPRNPEFSVETGSCVLMKGDSTLFYLYNPVEEENVLVYFGKSPFGKKKPKRLTILDGNESEKTLSKLVDLGIFVPSQAVLEHRIADMETLYEEAVRGAETSLEGSHPHFSKVIEKLRTISDYFRNVVNQGRRKDFVMNQPPELLEFVVCPFTDDPVFHELLPRTSWNKSLRQYNDTTSFIRDFQSSEEQMRARILEKVVSSIFFNFHQNQDTNVWLFNNHREFCEESGVRFNVVG